MKRILQLSLIALALGCSKSDESPDNKGKTLKATYRFYPGTSNAYGSYRDNMKNEIVGFENINTLTTFTDNVKLGDEVRLVMNTISQPKGEYSIALIIEGKLTQEVVAKDGGRNIQLIYRITDKDFK